MPRETITLNSFAGGLSNDSNPADIKDSEVSGLINLIVQPGKVKGLGKFTTENWATAIDVVKVIQPGYGLFTFSADYSSTGGIQATDYMVIAGKTTDDNSKAVQIFESDKTAMLTTGGARSFTINTSNDTTDFDVAMAYADGALRIGDSDFTQTITSTDLNIPQTLRSPARWIGIIDRQLFHASKGTTYSGWYMENQVLEAPLHAIFGTAQTVRYQFSSQAATAVGVVQLNVIPGSTGTGDWLYTDGYYLYASYVYDDKQESFPAYVGAVAYPSSVTSTATFSFRWRVKVKPGISNKRITGVRVYFTDNNVYQPEASDLKYLFGADFHSDRGIFDAVHGSKPKISLITGSYSATAIGGWSTVGAGSTDTIVAFTPQYSTGPDQYIETYESRNGGYDALQNKYIKYKSIVIANSKAYVGNVKVWNSIYSDVVIPSPVGKYDIFKYDDRLEIVPNDGDEIVKLEAIAKKLLVFKKNTMYIIDTSGETEVLDQEQKYRGIAKPSQAVRTENGVAWFNDNGCYYYDGTNTYDLLVDQSDPSRRKIQLEYWRKFFGNDPAIGYDAREKRLFVTDLMSTNSSTVGVTVLAYDFTNFGWTRLQGKLNSGNGLQKYTNIVTDWNGQATIIQSDNGVSRYKFNWASTATATTSAVYLKSKELFFDEPGIKKNLYAIHVKHKNSDGNVRVRYIKDGTSTVYATSPVYLPSSTSWLHTRLVPGDSTDAKNFKSLTLVVQNTTGTVSSSFEIDDIEIIYRKKGLR